MPHVLHILFSNLVIAFIIISTASATVIENSTKEIETKHSLTIQKYEECDCGPHSISCHLQYRTKICFCEKGYAPFKTIYLREETCKKCDCGPNSVSCKFESWNGNKECTCKQGYGRAYIGEETCKECDCGNGTCSLLRGKKECECYEKFAEMNGKCEECDCGEYSASCKLMNGNKDCTCKNGYAVFKEYVTDEQTCRKCDCGDGTCGFVSGVKRCRCNGKKVEVDGQCLDCYCGPNSISCSLDFMDKRRCTCKDGYSPSKPYSIGDESCKECDCGPHGISCSFDTYSFNQRKTCKCDYGGQTVSQEGQCKECECGPNSYSCYFNSQGGRRCSCHPGYQANSYYSWEDEYCNSITPVRSGDITGWRVATYIIAVLFAVVIIALLISIIKKSMDMSLTT